MIEVKSLFGVHCVHRRLAWSWQKHLQQDREVTKGGRLGLGKLPSSWTDGPEEEGEDRGAAKGQPGGASQSGSSVAAHWGPLQETELYWSASVNIPYSTVMSLQSLFGGLEQASHLAPGGSTMMSFFLATADRQAKGGWHGPCLSHNEFWGNGHTAE